MILRYSMIDAYISCPTKFNKSYVEMTAPKEDSSALRFGTAVHLALKTHFEGGDAEAVFNMYWAAVEKMGLGYDRFSHEQLGGLAKDRFLPNFIRLHSKKFTDVKQEETLLMPIEGTEHSLQGTYDVACMYEGKLSIVDYKTSAREYKYDKLERNPQMYIYAALYYHTYGVMPEQLVYKVFIKHDGRIQTLKIDLTKEKLDKMMKNVYSICEDLVKRIESKKWYCNYNSCYCNTPGDCY